MSERRDLNGMRSAPVHPARTVSGGLELDTDGFPRTPNKRVEVHSPVSSVYSSPSLLHPKLQAWCRCYLFFLTTLHTIMFFKATLAFLVVGALSVNALTVPVARSPAPEPECEFPQLLSITYYYGLTWSPLIAQELEARMLKRDPSYDLFSRELQALGELFSREPEDLAGFARDHYTAKREPNRARPASPKECIDLPEPPKPSQHCFK